MLNPVITPEVALMIKRQECGDCQTCQLQCEQTTAEALLSWQDRQALNEIDADAEYGAPKKGEALLRRMGYLKNFYEEAPLEREEELVDFVDLRTFHVTTRPMAKRLFESLKLS